MSEQIKILEMIEEGKISAQEGMELLNALKEADEEMDDNKEMEENKEEKKGESDPRRKQYKYIKIKVLSNKDKVNVNIPLKLVKALGGLASHITHLIPDDARKKMEDNGVDLSQLKIDQLLELLESGEFDNDTFVDVDSVDSEDGNVKVKIYVE